MSIQHPIISSHLSHPLTHYTIQQPDLSHHHPLRRPRATPLRRPRRHPLHLPFFAAICRGQFLESSSKRVSLPEEIPEVFSSVLEYLYKGDYYPRLLHNKRRNTWELEDTDTSNNNTVESTVYHQGFGQTLLKDTLVYCTAERYGLDELKRLALRKQGLQSGIQVTTILASARYAYANTPENDSKLRAHYLALIIRSRNIFKRSGTMQMEMEAGGLLFFDLFVAICNHMVRASPG